LSWLTLVSAEAATGLLALGRGRKFRNDCSALISLQRGNEGLGAGKSPLTSRSFNGQSGFLAGFGPAGQPRLLRGLPWDDPMRPAPAFWPVQVSHFMSSDFR
jgi:hypothetical protein